MTDHSELKRALSKWAEASISLLSQDLKKHASEPDYHWWRPDEHGNLILSNHNLTWNFRHVPELVLGLPEWKGVEEACQRDPISKQLGVLVGNVVVSHTEELDRWARSLLPQPKAKDFSWEVEVEEFDVFERRLNDSLEDFERSDCDILTLWPVLGLRGDVDSVPLDADVQLRYLAPAEMAWALQYGVIRAGRSVEFISHDQPRFHCLAWTHSLPKLVGEQEGEERWKLAHEHIVLQIDLLERFHLSMALSGFEAVYTPAHLQSAPTRDGFSCGYRNIATLPLIDHVFGLSRDVILMPERVADLQEAWAVLTLAKEASGHPLYLAARRLAIATTRENPEDSLLDLMISAEALFLTARDRPSRSKPMAERVREWSRDIVGGPGSDVSAATMMQAYLARNTIVHGSSLASLSVTGQLVDLIGLVRDAREVVRLGLLKALRAASANRPFAFKPPWG